MADNSAVTPGAGMTVAMREVTYSGDLAKAQAVGLVTFAGADDAKTVADVPAGEGAAATALRVDLATDGTVIGTVTETAPATDTASSGLNGRLQRLAQRLTSLIALLPAALGGGGGLKVEGVGTSGSPAGGVVTVQGSTGSGGASAYPRYTISNIAGSAIPMWLVNAALMSLTAGTDVNGTLEPLRTPSIFKSAVATASGNTAVWTPTTGKKFRLLRFMLVLTDEAAQAVAGDITVKFQDATTDIGISLPVYVPAAAIGSPIGEAWTSGWIDLGNGIVSAAANNVLNINLSAALTGGTFGVLTAGTEE